MARQETCVLVALTLLAGTAGVVAWPAAEVGPLPAVGDVPMAALPGATAALPAPAEPTATGAGARDRCERFLVGSCRDDRGCVVGGARIDVLGHAGGASTADGRFAVPLGLLEPPFAVRIDAADHVAVQCTIAGGAAAGGRLPFDLGTVSLPRAARLAGVVRDEHGQPVSGARVLLRRAAAPTQDSFRMCFSTAATSAGDGTFAFGDPLPPGPAFVVLDGVPQAADVAVELLPAGRQWCELRALLGDPAQRLEGAAVDERGRPSPFVLVQAFAGADLTRGCGGVRTDGDGGFRLCRPPDAPDTIWLAATGPVGGAGVGIGPLHWGARGVTVVTAGGDRVSLEVVDRVTGAPIAGYAVQCVPVNGTSSPTAAARRLDGEHPDGRSWLDGVAPGANLLVVWPADLRWLPSLPKAFDGADFGGTRILRVELERAAPCPVRVVDATGAALGGIAVDLLDGGDQPVVRDLDDLLATAGGRAGVALRLAHGITDREGRVLLRWRAADTTPRELRLAGARLPAQRVTGIRLGAAETVVQLAAAGRVELRLPGALGAHVVARPAGGGDRREPPVWAPPCVVDADGAAVIALPAGRWQLHLVRSLTLGGSALAAACEQPAFAAVDVAAGGVTTVRRDLRAALATGGLAGELRFAGEPARRIRLLCGEWTPSGTPRVRHVVDVAPDARGAFAIPGLAPGPYAVRATIACDGHDVEVEVAPFADLLPGASMQVPAVDLLAGGLTLRLCDAAGRAAAGHVVLAGPRGAALVGALAADGTFACTRLPAGTWRVQWRGDGDSAGLDAIEVVAGQAVSGNRTVR